MAARITQKETRELEQLIQFFTQEQIEVSLYDVVFWCLGRRVPQDFPPEFAERYWLSPAATSFRPRSRFTFNAVTIDETSLSWTGSDWE